MSIYDDLTNRMRSNVRGLSLLLEDVFTVLPDERDAVNHVVALVESWSLSDRRR